MCLGAQVDQAPARRQAPLIAQSLDRLLEVLRLGQAARRGALGLPCPGRPLGLDLAGPSAGLGRLGLGILGRLPWSGRGRALQPAKRREEGVSLDLHDRHFAAPRLRCR